MFDSPSHGLCLHLNRKLVKGWGHILTASVSLLPEEGSANGQCDGVKACHVLG